MQIIYPKLLLLKGILIWERLVTVKEAGRKPPPFPFIFFKPSTTVHDHGESVVIPKIAQNDQADYEGELVRSILSIRIAKTWNLTNLDTSVS